MAACKLKALGALAGNFSNSVRMPVLFLGHGSPMNAIEENEFVQGFRKVASEFGCPNAVLCISAHWETKGTWVTAMPQPKTIHDFGGFPKELYDVQYSAPGSPEMAKEVQRMIRSVHVEEDYSWGLDHGAWSVIKHLYPMADVPVIQMSIDYSRPAEYHYTLAAELSALRNKGVLIVGSGNMVHNLGMVDWKRLDEVGYGYDWALEARERINSAVLSGRHESLIRYEAQGRAFQLAIPTPEHFLPLLYVLGLTKEGEEVRLFNDKVLAGSLTMTSVKVG